MDISTMPDITSPPQYYAPPASYYPTVQQGIHTATSYAASLTPGDKHNAYNAQTAYAISQTPMSAPIYPTGIHMPMYSMYPGYSSPHIQPMDLYTARQPQAPLTGSGHSPVAYPSSSQQSLGPLYRSFGGIPKVGRYDRRTSNDKVGTNTSNRYGTSSGHYTNTRNNRPNEKVVDANSGRGSALVLQPVNPNKAQVPADTSTKSSLPACSPTSNVMESIVHSAVVDFPIPMAIAPPAGVTAFSLEESLKNPRKTTNVYIRGLAPDITDDILITIVSRFGSLTTAKAMMDSSTGMCKGFGFAQFETEREAIQCICGLSQYGYQTSFAKQSFALRLKELQDAQSTNVYFSNIPRFWDKAEFKQLLEGFPVVSIKVLRDGHGNNRGVGFARFVERNVAEDIISKFNGQPIGEGGMPIQVRFSDTEAQKRLKQVTLKKRSWRAHEYHLLAAQRALEDYSMPKPLMYKPFVLSPEAIPYPVPPALSGPVPLSGADQKIVHWSPDPQLRTTHETSSSDTSSAGSGDSKDTDA
ncbi:hypothetical protein V1517DRAFT_316481 [Lipomyces orientalis]|uniref:Uncharacterized protein n=1 Tax=Lipomyces orientalis TaxID=1233043 RepID=A0ACC3TV99_9ASCO